MMYRRLTRRRRRQYRLRLWIASRSLFFELLSTIFNSRSDFFDHLLRNDAVKRRQVGEVYKPIAEWLAHARKPLCNWSPTSPCIAKIPALFVVKPIAAPSKTDLRLTQDLFETSRRPMKPLSDQISRGQSFVHAQKKKKKKKKNSSRPIWSGDLSMTFWRLQ